MQVGRYEWVKWAGRTGGGPGGVGRGSTNHAKKQPGGERGLVGGGARQMKKIDNAARLKLEKGRNTGAKNGDHKDGTVKRESREVGETREARLQGAQEAKGKEDRDEAQIRGQGGDRAQE